MPLAVLLGEILICANKSFKTDTIAFANHNLFDHVT